MSEDTIAVNENANIKKHEKTNIWLIIVAITLFLILILNVYQFVDDKFIIDQKESERIETIEEAKRLARSNDLAINSLISDYEDSVYLNPNVETIMQQSFLAQEYTLISLQMIAVENSIIIDLLSSLP